MHIAIEEYKNYRINVDFDECPLNPRTDYDNSGTMICFHKRYMIGDKTELDSTSFNSWAELKDYICKENDIAVILPVYMYDHSGITINTSGFSCAWDSGQIGFIFITKEQVRQDYSCKRISPKIKSQAEKHLQAEIITYNRYLSGESYCYSIDSIDEENIDCAGGFDDQDYMIECAKELIDCLIRDIANLKEIKQGDKNQMEFDLVIA